MAAIAARFPEISIVPAPRRTRVRRDAGLAVRPPFTRCRQRSERVSDASRLPVRCGSAPFRKRQTGFRRVAIAARNAPAIVAPWRSSRASRCIRSVVLSAALIVLAAGAAAATPVKCQRAIVREATTLLQSRCADRRPLPRPSRARQVASATAERRRLGSQAPSADSRPRSGERVEARIRSAAAI